MGKGNFQNGKEYHCKNSRNETTKRDKRKRDFGETIQGGGKREIINQIGIVFLEEKGG